jgi:hypothetical protein
MVDIMLPVQVLWCGLLWRVKTALEHYVRRDIELFR